LCQYFIIETSKAIAHSSRCLHHISTTTQQQQQQQQQHDTKMEPEKEKRKTDKKLPLLATNGVSEQNNTPLF